MKRIVSPYRICPIGAHVDHQGGAVLGRTLALGTTLEYEPLAAREVHLISEAFGETRFAIGAAIDPAHWARYAQAAARLFGDRLQRGLRAHIDGSLFGSGLSSSASVGLAYIQALADVNGIVLTRSELVNLDFDLENGQLGLRNGRLDPITIVYGRKDALLFIDMLTAAITPLEDPADRPAWIVAYSGVSRELTKSGFNTRVAECQAAAALLCPGALTLSDVPHERFDANKSSLPEHLARRAEHFYSEVERVHQGAQAWREADWGRFGRLMNQSCESSIRNYESGSPVLVELHRIASGTKGVYGSRFSGGGYGGCVIALADRDQADAAVIEIQERFSSNHPELPARVFVAQTGDGLR